jgi:cysteine desulfurase
MENLIYLDNAATTKPHEEVLQKSLSVYREMYGNPSSLHSMGLDIEREINNSAKIIADCLNVEKSEIFFTSGGTESNNIAIQGIAKAYERSGNHIITTMAEHSSVKETCRYLGENGYIVTYLKVNEFGKIDMDELQQQITDKTILISLMHVNNETGSISDINKIGKLIKMKNKDTIFHVDGVQAFGKLPISLNDVDLYSISSHKIHGLKGTGALYIKKGTKIKPLFFGGGQQNKIRVGTENTVGIVCFGLAAKLAEESLKNSYNHVTNIRNELLQLTQLENVVINTCVENDLPYILNVSFLGVKSEILLHSLEAKGIFVSAGSACNAKKKDNSILMEYGIGFERVQSAVRFSFSKYTTVDEIVKTIEEIKKCLAELYTVRNV